MQVFHCHFNSNFFPLFLEHLLSDNISASTGSILLGKSPFRKYKIRIQVNWNVLFETQDVWRTHWELNSCLSDSNMQLFLLPPHRYLLHCSPLEQFVLLDSLPALWGLPGYPVVVSTQAGAWCGHSACRGWPHLPAVYLHCQVWQRVTSWGFLS